MTGYTTARTHSSLDINPVEKTISNTHVIHDPFMRVNFIPWRSMSGLPLVLQSEAAECGLACLAMISGFHGAKTDIMALRSRLGSSMRGVTLKQLGSQAALIGLSARMLRVEIGSLGDLALPCVLHWDMNHFVVLKKVGRKSIIVHDPAVGEVELDYDRFSEMFTGIALELAPNERFKPMDERTTPSIRSVVGNNKGIGKALAQIFVLALLLQILGLIGPAGMQWMIDSGLESGSRSIIVTLVAGMTFLLLFSLIIGTIRSWMLTYLTIQLGYRWTSRVLNHLFHLPIDFFEKRHLGDVMSRLGSVSAIQQTVTTGVIEGILDGIVGIGLLAMIWLYSPTLATTVIVSVVLLAAVQFAAYGKSKRIGNEALVADAKVSSSLMESIRGIRAIKLSDRIDHRRTAWQNLTIDSINVKVRQQWLGITVSTISSLISGGQRIIAIYIAASMISEGSFTIGMLFAYLAYQDQFAARAGKLIALFFSFKMLKLHLERLSDIVLTEPEAMACHDDGRDDSGHFSTQHHEAGGCAIADSAKHLGVVFSDVSFRYSELSPPVLSNLSFSSAGHACTVITGRSGIGKTTIAKIIMGIHKPTSGAVSVFGKDSSEIPMDALRRNVACVLQEDALFAGSIRDNIAFFDDEIDTSLVEECARTACIHEDIIGMPMGYHTLVGDMGSTLSSGQKKRVLIARALYRRPKILILDESTSDLDVATEESININLSKLDIHRIYIAHRPQTIKFGDHVVHLEG